MEKKKIIFISYDGMTDPLGQSQVLPYIEGLSAHGYQFTLVSCEKPENYHQNKIIIEEICQRSNIDWQPVFYKSTLPVISALGNVIAMSKKAEALHQAKHFDLFHCRSYIPGLIALKLHKKTGLRFLFDMRGFWADERVDAGLWNLSNPIYKIVYRYFKKKEKHLLEKASHTVSLTEVAAKEIYSWKHIQNNPIKMDVIPCCADTILFDSSKIDIVKNQALKKELGIEVSSFVLSYLGGIGIWYMLDEMLDFFKVLLKEKPDAKFLFITGNDSKEILNAATRKNISTEKIIIKKASRKDVPLFLSLSQVSIFFIKPTYSKMSSSPTKQGEIMAMGIPVICNAGVGDTDAIVKKYKAGIVVNEFNNTEYQKAISMYLSTSFADDKIREGALDYFDLKQGVDKYNSIYNSLFS